MSGRLKNPLLDGIRGLAVFGVLLFHAFFSFPPHTFPEYLVRKTLAPLWISVNIFFVLSGFLITGILIDTKKMPHYFRSFYARRILRISPLYFAVLAFAFLILPALRLLPLTPAAVQMPYWTYTYNWSAALGSQAFALGHFWSLAVEEQFYLVWPVLLFFTPVRRMPAVFVSILCASFLFRLALFLLNLPSRYAYFLTPARVEDLCFGALAAWILRDPPSLAWLRPRAARMAWMFAVLCAAAYAMGKGFEANKWPVLLFGTTAVCGLTALALIQSSIEIRPRWWGTAGLRWLGTYSYGIYVFHQPIIVALDSRLTGVPLPQYAAVMVGAMALSCMAAWLSFQLFERHFLRLKSHFAPG